MEPAGSGSEAILKHWNFETSIEGSGLVMAGVSLLRQHSSFPLLNSEHSTLSPSALAVPVVKGPLHCYWTSPVAQAYNLGSGPLTTDLVLDSGL